MNVIGLGVDVVDVERVEGILERTPGWPARYFAEDEIAFCEASGQRARCYAARWAAKEACAKALGGVPGGRWREIRVVRGDDGQVTIELDGSAAERGRAVGVERVLVSFSHERGVAVAACLAVGQ
ncbi:MAG TPA: holo-ACP synthase [Actinomycetota bacterium]|nr:holo-ACP synthase [Actinomycetota bacterium]